MNLYRTPFARSGENSKGFEVLHLKVKAIIWPGLSLVRHIRSNSEKCDSLIAVEGSTFVSLNSRRESDNEEEKKKS